MNKLLQIFKRPDLRNRVLFILAILVVFRLVSNIPIPAVDASQLKDFFAQNQFFGLISTFTGGSLAALSIGMLGLGPYITSSIIMQLLTMIFQSIFSFTDRTVGRFAGIWISGSLVPTRGYRKFNHDGVGKCDFSNYCRQCVFDVAWGTDNREKSWQRSVSSYIGRH